MALAQGSWLEPVGDRRFDLILATSPSSSRRTLSASTRDSGGAPGEISRSVLQGAASRLAEGGSAHVKCEWGVSEGEEWSSGTVEVGEGNRLRRGDPAG